MDSRDVAIQISGVTKQYQPAQRGGGTLTLDLQTWGVRVRGKEDPNTKSGTERIKGETLMALNGVSLTVCKGERVGIIGRNGAGKSTLLKLLCRVTAPTDGEIDIYGRITSMLEVGTGFHGEMTGRENIYMNGAILGMKKAEIDKKIEDIIDFSEVREFIDTPVKRYSSGMFVKLAFSVAAHLDSEIMIMDEVLAVGDMAFQKKCLDKMSDVSLSEGRTVLYVSHNMNTIRRLCDRCIVMDEGKILFDGDVEKAIALYLGKNQEIKSSYRYTEKNHNQYHFDQAFRFDSLDIIQNDKSYYECGEKIALDVCIHTEKNWESVGLRFEIQGEQGATVGSMFSESMYGFRISDANRIRITMDTRHLAPGRYRVDMVAFTKGPTDEDSFVDGVYPAFSFELSDMINDVNNIRWLHRFWGSTRLSNLRVE